MAESPRGVDLRLTIPASAPFHSVAGELAGKFAEFAGTGADAAHRFARSVEAILAPIGASSTTGSVDLEIAAEDHELVLTATSGSIIKRLTCPLPD
jgi:hypothetical protein